jgi:ketosteroid isomerase-like protein
MLTEQQIEAFASDWYEAWNAHDLDRILGHYREDVVFVSPLVSEIAGDPSGRLEGKAALRDYFAKGLERFPDLAFEPLLSAAGVDSVVLVYVSVNDRRACEAMVLDDQGLVREARAHYGA